MTDQVTESQVTEEAPKFPDEMAEASFNTLSGLITQRNNKVGQINAAKGDVDLLRQQFENESEDEDLVSLREARDAAQLAYDEAVMALHDAVTPKITAFMEDSESGVKGLEDEVKSLDEKIKPGSTYFKKMYGEVLAKHLPPLARLKGFSTKGAGASGRRIRGYVVDVTVDGVSKPFDNLASAAKWLVVDTKVLQDAFFEAAGNPEKLKDAPDEVNFNVEFTETYEDDSTEQKTAHLVATREHDEAPVEDTSEDEVETTESE